MLAVTVLWREIYYETCRQPPCNHRCWHAFCELQPRSVALAQLHRPEFGTSAEHLTSPKFVQCVDVLLILYCVSSHACQTKKVREWLAPGSGGGQLIASCTGLCSQNFFSYRKISQSEIIISDCWWIFLMSWIYSEFNDTLRPPGCKNMKLVLLTHHKWCICSSCTVTVILNKRQVPTELLLLLVFAPLQSRD